MFRTVADIVDSTSLTRREHAAIAKEGIDPPEGWQFEHRWKLASQPGWDAAWESALAGHPDDPDYDPGDDPGVITDGMILSAIQSLVEADKPPIVASPTMVLTVPSTHPKVVAEPLTVWADNQFATFTDGEFTWDGASWVPYVSAPPPVVDNDLPDTPEPKEPEQ